MRPERLSLARLECEFASLVPPALPRPLPPLLSLAYQVWRVAFQEYADRRQELRQAILDRTGVMP